VDSEELYFTKFGEYLTKECKTLLTGYVKSDGKIAIYKIEEDSKEWDDGPKKRWVKLTESIIDRTPLWQRILRRTGYVLIVLFILFLISDEFYHYYNYRIKFVNSIKYFKVIN
jgi:hypothetical protein